jgi:hypothetical protein
LHRVVLAFAVAYCRVAMRRTYDCFDSISMAASSAPTSVLKLS